MRMGVSFRSLIALVALVVVSCSSGRSPRDPNAASDSLPASILAESGPEHPDESNVDGSVVTTPDEEPPVEEFVPFDLHVGPTDLRAAAFVAWLTGYEPALADYPTVGMDHAVIHVGPTSIEYGPDISVSGSCAIVDALERRSGSSGAASKRCVVFGDLTDNGPEDPWLFLLSVGDLVEWSAETGWAAVFEAQGEANVVVTGYDPDRSLAEIEGGVAIESAVDPTSCGDDVPVGLLQLDTATVSEVVCSTVGITY